MGVSSHSLSVFCFFFVLDVRVLDTPGFDLVTLPVTAISQSAVAFVAWFLIVSLVCGSFVRLLLIRPEYECHSNVPPGLS